MRHSKLFTILGILFILISTAFDVHGQIKFREVSIYGHRATIFPTNPFLRGLNAKNQAIDTYNAVSLHLAFSPGEHSMWNYYFRDISFGVGAQLTDFPQTYELGSPYSIYGFVQSKIFSTKRFELRFNGELGMANDWRPLTADNHWNDVISLERTVHIDLGLDLRFKLANHHYAGIGLSATHFSNAAIRRPNQGINSGVAKVFYAWKIKEVERKPVVKPAFNAHNVLDFQIFGGYHHYSGIDEAEFVEDPYKGVNVRVFGLGMTFARRLNPVFKLGVGTDVTWDEGLSLDKGVVEGQVYNRNASSTDNFAVSIFPSLEIRMMRVGLVLEPGTYVHRDSNVFDLPKSYQRLGIRLYLREGVNIGAALRAYNFKSANFMEMRLGFSL